MASQTAYTGGSRALELRFEGSEHFFEGVTQIEAATTHAGLVYRHLFEMADQFGGTGGVAFQQLGGLTATTEELFELGAAQGAAIDCAGELLQVFAQGAGHSAGIAQRRVEFVRHASHQIAQGSHFS